MNRFGIGTLGVRSLLGLGMVLLVGCGQAAFIGQRYDNFTAYYNKFYNAENAFQKGVESLEDQKRTVNRTEYLSIFLTPQEGGNEDPFENAIQKSADVLREHPDSKWVDDALLLIGKSYFYQNNYIGAAQKFREVLALDAERDQEARFWLARTQVASEQYDAAAEVLRALEGERRAEANPWTARLYLVRGELLVRQERWPEAAEALQIGLRGDVPEEVGARAAFLLGQVQETMGADGPARTAYQSVQDYDPSYELSLAATLSDIELQGAREPDVALDRLEELSSDDKNYEKRGELALVRARVYRAQGQYDRARQSLRAALYGEDTPSGTSEGRLHYDLGTLYRDAYKDFRRAAAHFDTASTGLSQGASQSEGQSLPAAPVDADQQADRYRNLAERAREVARMDSLLRVGRMSDQQFQVFVQELRRRRQAAQDTREATRQQSTRSQQFRQRGQALGDRRPSNNAATDTRESDAGFLFHQDPTRVQQGRQQFQKVWGDRSRVDNWRRREALRSSSSATTASTSETEQPAESTQAGDPTDTGNAAGTRAGGGALDLSDIPRDSSSQAEMEANRAVARYELANSLFLAAGRPDSAATWYRRILQENGDQPVARRALYALGEAYRAQGDTTAAQQTYLRLIDQHPNTDLAARARKRLGRETTARPNTAAALADTAYARAYEQWQQGHWRPALDSLLTIADRHPDTEAAPRALLASGIIYWRRTQTDSASVPRTVMDRHLRVLGASTADSVRRAPQAGPPADSATTPSRSDTLATASRESAQTAPRPATDTTAASVRDSGRVAAASPSRSASDPVNSGESSRDPAGGGASVSSAGDVYTPLTSLLDHLTRQYADAPQAERARVLLSMIEEQRAPADTGSTGTDPPLTPDADTTGRARPSADSVARASAENATPVRPSADTVQAQSEDRSAPDESTPKDSEKGSSADASDPLPAPTSPDAGSTSEGNEEDSMPERPWTLLVERFRQSQEASVRVAELGRQLGEEWKVDLLQTAGERDRYLLVIGAFETEEAAVRAQAQLSERVSGSLDVYRRSEGDVGQEPDR